MNIQRFLIGFTFVLTILSFNLSYAQLIEKWKVDIPELPDYYYPTYHFDTEGNVYGIRYKIDDSWIFRANIFKVSTEGILEWFIEDAINVDGDHFRLNRSGVDRYGNIYLLGTTFNYDSVGYIPCFVKYSPNGVKLFEKSYIPPYYRPGSSDIRAWGVNADGNIFAVGWFGVVEGNIVTTYGCALSFSSDGILMSESIFNDGITPSSISAEQSNGPKGPDMNGNYVVQFGNSLSNDEIVLHIVGYNSSAGMLWKASSPPMPRINIDYSWALYSYTVFQVGNIYYTGGSHNIIKKYTPNFQLQWVKNYLTYNNYLWAENPYDESIIITESGENPPAVCYNADGTLRWRSLYASGTVAYGPDNYIYTFIPSQLRKVNSQTGELVWTDTINVTTVQRQGMRIDQNGRIIMANNRFVVQFIQGIEVIHPKKDTLMIAGEVDTIRWKGGKEDQFLNIQYSVDGGRTYNWVNLEQVEASEGKYGWDIPDDIIGRKAIIKILDATTGDSLGVSDTFKIKPYIITRVDENGEYVAYDINTDKWGFWNADFDVWPQNWWQRFDYWGIDPFTNKSYSFWQGDSVFFRAKSSDHPDWVSFVNTFGVNSCYADINIRAYWPKALQLWKAIKRDWRGSCFGIAISNALAFEMKDQFQTAYPDFPDIISPHLVTSDTNTIKVVNELFTHQFGNPHFSIRTNSISNKTPTETINDLKKMLKEDDVKIRTLAFYSNSVDPQNQGGHSIVAYKLTRSEYIPEYYYVHVYDNSYPSILDATIRIDTSENDGKGSWYPDYGWNDWGGDKWFFLEDSVNSYFSNPIIPKSNLKRSTFIFEDDKLHIYNSSDAYIVIEDNSGNQTGLTSNGLIVNIPNSVPLIKLDGGIGPPYGYYLPKDNYSVVINNFLADTLNTFFFTGNKSFEYERYGAINSQTDRLFFDGGVSVVNPDAEEKSIKLISITTTKDDEKVFILRSLKLAQNDSVKINNPDDNKLDLINYGSAKNYHIELNQVSQSGVGRFSNSNVSLQANSRHKLTPDWRDFADLGLAIYVDQGNDGTIDDTLQVQNELTGVHDHGSLIPREYKLYQNFPNPFNPTTIIRYAIPKESFVTLKVFNLLGQEVATLVNEEKQAGSYKVQFDGSTLSSGIYYYRIKADNFVEAKKLILLR